MLYCENFDAITKKHAEFWARENHDRPLLSITAPKDGAKPLPVSNHASLKERWCDVEYMLKCAEHRMQNVFFAGDALPQHWANLGPDIFAALYGTELEFGEDTSWAEPFMTDDDVENFTGISLKKDGEYYKKIGEMTSALTEFARDKFIVGVTDLHPGVDALVAMRGPQELCIDTLDNPEFFCKGAFALLDGFKEVFNDHYALTSKYQGGTTNWMGIWHPGRWYVTSCDFSCMISEQMFEDFVIPELIEEIKFLDASVYHLDGPDALKHLDRLLQIEELKGIQWVYGAGQPTAVHWIDVIKKIQNSGKSVQINAEPHELKTLLENVSPEGIMYCITAENEEQAKELVKMAENFKK